MSIRNSLSFFFLLIILVGLSACAHKKPAYGPHPPPWIQEGTAPQAELPPGIAPTENNEAARHSGERPRIALVIGGAGVASFATVGLLKRLREEGIEIELIVTTGWPTLFSLGYGFLRSVHDLEWFAMRLQEKDFYKAGILDRNDYASHEKLSSLIENSFAQKTLGETKIPIVISAANTEFGDPEIYSRGEWKEPFLKTMSVPGIYRPYPKGSDQEWIHSLQGLDVGEALQQGARTIVAVQMYNDYFAFLKTSKKDPSQKMFRQLYLAQLNKSLRQEMKQAQVTGEITLHRSPTDFTAKRAAILAGYKEGARIAKLLRSSFH